MNKVRLETVVLDCKVQNRKSLGIRLGGLVGTRSWKALDVIAVLSCRQWSLLSV